MSRNRSKFGVVALIVALIVGCSLRTDEFTDPAAVSVTFTDEATAGEMAAFFEGFNAGSFAGRLETMALTSTPTSVEWRSRSRALRRQTDSS